MVEAVFGGGRSGIMSHPSLKLWTLCPNALIDEQINPWAMEHMKFWYL